MNEQFIDFFMTITPTILTSLTAFLLGKYNYFQNRPTDKMEISYSRVYYPISRIMREDTIEISTVINQVEIYFLKYDKYIDRSTIMVYKQLCECADEEEKRRIYGVFSNNIQNSCIYLRKRLGYMQPGYFQMYIYSPVKIKKLIRILLEFTVFYFCACVFSFVKFEPIKAACMIIFTIDLCVILLEVTSIIFKKIIMIARKRFRNIIKRSGHI